jgi:hypothetical protein
MEINQLCITFDFLSVRYSESVQQVVENYGYKEEEQEEEKSVGDTFGVDLQR